MAGYTRQSVADIINGAEITAPPLNAEFNQLRNAFNATGGHLHDGSAGNAPAINLQTSVSGYLLPINGGTGGKNKVDATSNPTLTDDVVAGYAPGSIWFNTSTSRIFICVNNTSSAAIWFEAVGQTATEISPEVTNTVSVGTTTNRYKDLFLSGSIDGTQNATFGGTLNVTGITTVGTLNGTKASVTGLTTLAQVDANSGTIDGTVIGSTSPAPITGTTITSTTGFTGDLVGDVTGNVTSAGTSTFNNITATGTTTGTFVGGITGNVTATTGSSQFNNVTINGTLNMDGATTATIENLTDPVNLQDAATKNYVDVGLANLVDASPAALDTLNELAAALGDDANFSTTMTTALAGKVADTGDTMTGNLIMSGATVTGLPLPTTNTEASSKQYTDQQDALQVTRAGDTMSGSLGMGGNKITNLGTPSANADAATKVYVDGILGSATSAAQSASDALRDKELVVQHLADTITAKDLAEDAAEATQTNFDSFDSRYLGSKSSAPSTDNSGGSLATGGLYFNSTDAQLYLWNGSAWTAAAFTAQGFLSGANNLSDVSDAAQSRTNLNVDEAGTALALAIALG